MYKVERNISIGKYTSFGIEAGASAMVVVDNEAQIEAILSDKTLPRPLLPLGGGSNTVFVKDFPGTVLLMRNAQWSRSGNTVRVGAGMSLDDFAQICCDQGLWGIENLSGIPGSVGGAIAGNAGAYGAEISDCLESVDCIDLDSESPVKFTRGQCNFAYRRSIFKTNPGCWLIISATFKLSADPQPNLSYGHLEDAVEDPSSLHSIREAVLKTRAEKLPAVNEFGSAGSFFKNPVVVHSIFEAARESLPGVSVPHYELSNGNVKIPAAFLIDKAGLKSYRSENLCLWATAPLVITNIGGHATVAELLAYKEHIKSEVLSRFGITLEEEVLYV